MSYLILGAIAVVLGGWYVYKHSGLIKTKVVDLSEKVQTTVTDGVAKYSNSIVDLTAKPTVENSTVNPMPVSDFIAPKE